MLSIKKFEVLEPNLLSSSGVIFDKKTLRNCFHRLSGTLHDELTSNRRHRHQHESYLVNLWNDGTTSLLTLICTEKNQNNISHQIMQSSIALQIKTQYKNKQYILYHKYGASKKKKINRSILQKINS